MDESGFAKNRRSRRSPVLLSASVMLSGEKVAVRLRNLSEDGALIEGDRLPEEGSMTWFERKDLQVRGRVVWVHGRYAGIAFEQALDREQVLRNIPKTRSTAQQEFRRPGLACRPLSDHERRMLERWMTASPTGHFGD
ncbi:MAG TPA: PilZ domain-containing protein [Sphingomicrobium sp.]|nr:PilZ domain-containing protein [Sphingomicrobium sp.]